MWWGRVGFSFFLGQHTAPVLTGSTRVHLPKSFLGKQLDNCTQEIWCFSSTSTIIIVDNGHVMRTFFKNIPKNWLIWSDGPNKLWNIWDIPVDIWSLCVPII